MKELGNISSDKNKAPGIPTKYCLLLLRTDNMADYRFDVVVVGSCFIDMISYVPHFPKFYETVKGTKFQLDFGGKAANQCVMAQKLGANTVMIAKTGNDQFGKDTIQNFKKFGVNTDFISATDKAETGITSIGKVLHSILNPGGHVIFSSRGLSRRGKIILPRRERPLLAGNVIFCIVLELIKT